MDPQNQLCSADQALPSGVELMSAPAALPLECSPATSARGIGPADTRHDNPLLASVPPVIDLSQLDGAESPARGLAGTGSAVGSPPTHPATDELELCERIADIPVLNKLGVQHWWLRDKNIETGMGKRGAGVPGQPGGSAYTLSTTLNDHTGQGEAAGATCTPVGQVDSRWANEDPACIAAETKLGTATGPWLPPFNDCHEVVKQILDDCRTPGLPGAPVPAMGAFAPTDGGVSELPDGGVPASN